MKIYVKKGLDLNIAGAADMPTGVIERITPREVAIVPDDFTGLIPKLEVKEGDTVQIGSPLFHDKANEQIKVVSPVSGTVKSVVRGLRRKIERVEIDPDGAMSATEFSIGTQTPDSLKSLLMSSGLWAMMRQRPYDIVPDAQSTPRNIFVTAFDSAPLAPILTIGMEQAAADINAGISALKQFTDGTIYIGVRHSSDLPTISGAEILEIEGPHPAGNVGTQIAAVSPVNKGEVVWTLDITTLRKIGHIVNHGTLDVDVVVAITGGEVQTPHYITTVPGCDIASLLGNNIKEDGRHHRVISGNVLTGVAVGVAGHLRWPYRQVTVIPEGDDVAEFLGWANPGADKMSVKRSFIGHFLSKAFNPDARIKGGRRAIILSGEYDKVLPMDILAEYLIKAILSKDIDKMEQLGIYEVAPEDFALPEYVDTSKLELQKIVREGLDYLRHELA
jgi:Na+-transporting NADH:ubiquinone oxidoreductase subunit A